MHITRKTGILVGAATAGALALGGAGAVTATAAGTEAPARAAAEAPVPNAGELADAIALLGDLNSAIEPVVEALRAVAEAENGQLSEEDATRYAEAIGEALKPLLARAGQGTDAEALPAAATQVQAQSEALFTAAAGDDPELTAAALESTLSSASALVAAAVLSGGLPIADLADPPAGTQPAQTLPTTPDSVPESAPDNADSAPQTLPDLSPVGPRDVG